MTLPVLESFDVSVSIEATSIVVTKPTGVAVGDTLLALFVTDGGGESLQPPSTAWVNGCTNTSNTMTLRYFWKTATAADVSATDYTFTLGSSEEIVCGMVRMSGCDTSGVLVDRWAIATGSSATPTCPSITTTVDDVLVLRGYGCDDDELDVEDAGYPGGTTGLYARRSSLATAGECTSGLAHENQVTAGATGTAAFTIDDIEGWVAITIGIREPQTAPTGKDVQVQHGHYALPTGAGNDSFTGLNFTPIALAFFGNLDITGGGNTPDAVFWQGMMNSTNEFALSCYGEDAAQNTHRHIDETNGMMCLLPPGATNAFLGAHVSFNSDGFTVNFATGAPANTVAHFIAIGGADAQVFVGSVAANVLGSVVDVGFRMDMLFAMNSGLGLGGADSEHAIQSTGIACRNRDQGSNDVVALHNQAAVIAYQGNDVADQDAKHSVLETDIFTGQQFTNARTWGIRLDHVTGNQFSWGDTENADGFYFLAIHTAGLKCEVGNFAKSTAAEPAAQSLPELNMVPQAYGLISGKQTDTLNTPANDSSICIGNLSDRAGASLVQGAVSNHDLNNATDSTQLQTAGSLMQFLGPTDTIVATAVGDAIDGSTTPGFTWDPNDANAYLIGYWAIEAPPRGQHPIVVGTNT